MRSGKARGLLAGWSAGALCWFEGGTTDAYGKNTFRPFTKGLGLLPGSHCPHFDTPGRREVFEDLIGRGAIPDGMAIDEDAIVHYRGTAIERVLTVTEGSTAYRTELVGGTAVTTPLAAWEWGTVGRALD